MDPVKQVTRKLRRNQGSILNDAEVELLAGQLRSLLVTEFPHVFVGRTAETFQDRIRWHAITARCQEARDKRGWSLKAAAVAARIPQYRAMETEMGYLRSFRPDLAWQYFSSLGLETWVRRWARANSELAERSGLAEAAITHGDRSQGKFAGDLTTRSSGRTRTSQPMQGKGRAARPRR